MKRLIVVLTLFLAAAAVHAAGTGTSFTVTLKNGTTFETRYRPVQAEWDPKVSMINTSQGNWIALMNDDIVDVSSAAERSGFGYQVDTTTIYLGWSPNDLVGEDEEGKAKLNYEVGDIPESAIDSSINQFLNIDSVSAGSTAGSVPLYAGTAED